MNKGNRIKHHKGTHLEKSHKLLIGLVSIVICAVVFIVCARSNEKPNAALSPEFIVPAQTEEQVEESTPTPEPTPTVEPTQTPTPTPEPTPEIPDLATEHEIDLIAWTIWGEYSGCTDWYRLSTVAWCILNRVDAFGRSIESIVEEPNQFYTISSGCPQYCFDIAEDVVERWEMEHAGYEDVGRTLPEGYMWYWGDGETNWMRDSYSDPFDVYSFWMDDPYV